MSEKFLPAFCVPVVREGQEFASGELPLHITLFPPLSAQYTDHIGDTLKEAMNPLQAFDVMVGESAMFGADESIPVKLIESSSRLEEVHGLLVKHVGILLHDPTWRQPYNPHISVHDTATVNTGESIHVGGFAIMAKAADSNWKVVDKVGFKG